MEIRPRGDYVAGRFVRPRRPDRQIPTVDPGDSDVIIGDFAVSSGAPGAAIDAARAALPGWRALPPERRATALRKLRAELRNRFEELVEVLSCETGRPLWETRDEVQQMHGELDALLYHGQAELGLRSPPPGDCEVRFEPLGVVVVVCPYTQPALLMHLDAVSAMLAGCTVVCKPSERTPAAGQLYAEIVHEADLPRGVFNLVLGDAATGQALVTDPGVDGVLFTGSAAVAAQIRASLADREDLMVRASTSDHATAIVLDDAQLEDTAHQIVIGQCTSAGQRCTSTRRVLATRRAAAPLVERLATLLQQIKVGYALDPGVFMGPLISSQAVQRYQRELELIGELGGDAIVAGAPLSSRRRGFYVTPSLQRLPLEAQLTQGAREVLGPLLTVSEVDGLDEALELVGRSPLGLTASVFTRGAGELPARCRGAAPAVLQWNRPTTDLPLRAPLQARGRSGHAPRAGTLTPRACTRVVVETHRRAAVDLTALPTGLLR